MAIGNLWHPERYQGARRRYPYFEGWYFKLVDASERHRYAVIPGVSKGPTLTASQAFVQFLDGSTGQAIFVRYPFTEFHASSETFSIQVRPKRFSRDEIVLALDGPELALSGEVGLLGSPPWPRRWYAPGIMGWFSFVPFMQCYHGIVSLDHGLEGELCLNGTHVDLSGGRGYTEKDWGSAFPSAWVWFQSNHFDNAHTSLTASVATIPWLGSEFAGFIIGLWHDSRLYRFATYTGARLEALRVDEDSIDWVIADKRLRLRVQITRDRAGQLYAPDIADMSGRVGETLGASATVTLAARCLTGADDTVIFSERARLGALEVVGDWTRLAAGARS